MPGAVRAVRNGSTRTWRRLRASVLAASDVCHLCGQHGADSVDHLQPVSQGGAMHDPRNLAPAHLLCNLRRGTNALPQVRNSRQW